MWIAPIDVWLRQYFERLVDAWRANILNDICSVIRRSKKITTALKGCFSFQQEYTSEGNLQQAFPFWVVNNPE